MSHEPSPLGSSGIPLLMTPKQVARPRCIECGSLDTWTLGSAAPFTGEPMQSRLCDNCGRVTSALAPVKEVNSGEHPNSQAPGSTRHRSPGNPH